jgi:hypothetical protein
MTERDQEKELLAAVARLTTEPGLQFHALAALLSELVELTEGGLLAQYPQLNLSRRRAYYLIGVGDLIRRYGLSKTDAEAVGWTKLQIIARHARRRSEPLSRNELGGWLELASSLPAHQLADAIQGRAPKQAGSTRAVLFRMPSDLYAEIEEELIANGARRRGRGLVGKEEALVRMVQSRGAKAPH